jgi:hypothetical protein
MSKTGADILVAVGDAVTIIGKEGATRVPRVNDATDKAVIELAIAKRIKDEAEARHDAARQAVKEIFKTTVEALPKGAHALHASRYAALTCRVKSGASRLDEQKLLPTLVKEFNCTPEKAQAIVEACKKTGAPVVELSATLLTAE